MSRLLACLLIASVAAIIPSRLPAAEPNRPERQFILQNAWKEASKDRFWKEIATREPDGSMSLRTVFSYAMALGEARVHPERQERLFDLGSQAQDRDPESRGYGNLKWYWRDKGVTDTNAIEFCMQDGLTLWLRHRDWIPQPAREKLRRIMELAIEGCLRHRVPTSYTNIANFNAGNLIVLGESLGRTDVAEEGYRRFDAVTRWTWEFGTHEYASPTYYGTDLSGLGFIYRNAGRPEARRQAAALLELFWTDVALNWFPPAQKLAGSESRTYDYLRGLGSLDTHLLVQGWIPGEVRLNTELIQPALATWNPPDDLRQASVRFPRLVRQSWGSKASESRTHLVYPDVTLGTSGATYGTTDMPLTVDLPGDRELTRCYFIADGREDPYGKKKFPTGTAGHPKPLHLTPFWAAAQRGRDALGLVVYRPQDLTADNLINLQSHIVMRRGMDGFWLRGRKITVPDAKSEKPVRVPLAAGDPLVFRLGTAAVGICVLWSRDKDGKPAALALVNDDNEYGALRLTVEHGLPCRPASQGKSASPRPLAGEGQGVRAGDRGTTSTELPPPAAAFWVRIGSRLTSDGDFDQWRRRFEEAKPTTVQTAADRLRLEVPGEDGNVSVDASAPFGDGGAVRLLPAPCRGTLELDGREIGRPMLDSLDSIQSYRRSVKTYTPPHQQQNPGLLSV